MSEQTHIARPYAKAVFELAVEKKELKHWSLVLKALMMIAKLPDFIAMVKNPEVSDKRLADFIIKTVGKNFDQASQNLIHLLAKNHRLQSMPSISDRYEELCRDYEKTLQAQVISFQPLLETQQEQIIAALEKRFKRKVSLECETDKHLLGGAVIKVGDFVIDGSARGKLNRLMNHLNLKESVCQ